MVRHSRLERDWAADVLLSLVTDTPTRLKVGSEMRAKMLRELEKGETLTGYRPIWVKKSAHEVVGLLRDIAERFNDEHSTDQASIIDMLDMLATASNLLSNALSNGQPTTPEQPQSQALS
jgi:hypothetical protein